MRSCLFNFVLFSAVLFLNAGCGLELRSKPTAQNSAGGNNPPKYYVIDTIAGVPSTSGSFGGDGGSAKSALFSGPNSLSLDGLGNLYIADSQNHRVREMNLASGLISTVAGNGSEVMAGDGGSATNASLSVYMGGIAVYKDLALYIIDYECVRVVDLKTGIISTFAGTGTFGSGGDGGPATSAHLNAPTSIAIDNFGSLYIADDSGLVVRKVDIATHIISTIAGTGEGYSGDGGAATKASFNEIFSLFLDAEGNLFADDLGNRVIREISAQSGIISTVAGDGTFGYTGDGGSATSAQLSDAESVAVDGKGNIYISDTISNDVIRKVDAGSGIITTIAGNGTTGYGGDGNPALGAMLNTPMGIVVDASGVVYFADVGNNVIRTLTPIP